MYGLRLYHQYLLLTLRLGKWFVARFAGGSELTEYLAADGSHRDVAVDHLSIPPAHGRDILRTSNQT